MARFILPVIIASVCATVAPALADEEIVYDNFQTIYTETPVQSYYAYPDDPNFIPETEFMERADSLDYDQNIIDARATEEQAHPGVIFADRPMGVTWTRPKDESVHVSKATPVFIYARQTRFRVTACNQAYRSQSAVALPTPWSRFPRQPFPR